MDHSHRLMLEESIERVLGVSIRDRAERTNQNSKIVFLDNLAKELKIELQEENVFLCGELAERVLMTRLSEYPQDSGHDSPLLYLLSCYTRCQDELRKVSAISDAPLLEKMESNILHVMKLIVSYVGLLLSMNMFPQSAKFEQRGVLQLLDAMIENKVPVGFLEDFSDRFKDDGLLDVIIPMVKELGKCMMNVSPLGDFKTPLEILKGLLSVKTIANLAVKSDNWLGNLSNGRSIEYETLLGPFFKVSTLPDIFGNGKPSIRQYFSDLENRQNVEIVNMVKSIRLSIVDLQNYLQGIVLDLLRNQSTRESMLDWIATAIKVNLGRSKMRIDLLKCATHGFFFNLSSVMLHLCLPFMDPISAKAWERIDIDYVYNSTRLAFEDETRCAASMEDVKVWIIEKEKQKDNPKKFHFICDCFFLTAKVLHLGLVKSIRDFLDNMKELRRHQHMLQRLEASKHIWTNGPYRRQTEQQMIQLKSWINEHKEMHLCYECAIQEENLLHYSLLYYRLMCSWLLRLISKDNDFSQISPVGTLFKMLPEFFVDDAVELLLFTARIAERQHRVLQDEDLETFMTFLVIFMGCPEHIKNPYLRAKMVDVLHHWIPSPHASNPLASKMASLFEYHSVGNRFLVEHLLHFYVDIEFTGSNTQFYDKFNIRHHIGEMLQYLWEIPVHRENWKNLADRTAESFYLRFVNMLVNDAIYLLDEGMKKLPEVRQTLEAMENPETWNSQPPQEQAERESTLRQNEDLLRQDLLLANVHIEMLQYTTVEISKAFLLPEMVERIATMLNYFLRFLVGPERKQLKVKNPQKYGWNPHKMLCQIMRIYMHLAAADGKGDFATAIARDGRSYSNDFFLEAQSIAERCMLLSSEEMAFFAEFVEKVKSQVAADAAEDEILGEIPDEFLDPIQYTLMHDPVMLPSSKVIVDRATIQRHLLSDQTDPFNRSELNVDMLIPQDDLKKKIGDWLCSQRNKKK